MRFTIPYKNGIIKEVHMEKKLFRRNEVIFRKGDPGNCMYEVDLGRVGIYSNYGTQEEKLLTEFFPDQYFGEMGLLDHAPRSATAVALEDGTCLTPVTEDGFDAYFKENPMRVLMVVQQLSHNLRKRTRDYIEVCGKVKELTEKEAQA